MSADGSAPAGQSPSGFAATCTEVGSWLWGTVSGAFNEKASLSQIIVDAVIGMIPLVGDVTAVRDLIAVTIGMVDEPRKRDDRWQWVLLVVLIFALIPVVGGVIKGVGKLIIKAVGEAAKLATDAERLAHMAEAAKEIIAFLNHFGKGGNAEKWLLKLRFAEYQAQVIEKINGVFVAFNRALDKSAKTLGEVLPQSLLQRIEGLKTGIGQLKTKAGNMIPEAIKELDDKLKQIQSFIRSGGETTSRATEHVVASGQTATRTYTDEARLIENADGAVRSAQGGWAKNAAVNTKRGVAEIEKVYKYEPGYPNLLERHPVDKRIGKEVFTNITTYSGKITNRTLNADETVYRVFGPAGVTHDTKVGESFAAGDPKYTAKFFGLGPPPDAAKIWRPESGVIDEWNHDGFIAVGKVKAPGEIKACTGKIAEQSGQNIPGQYLPGGGQQAMIEMAAADTAAVNAAAAQVIATGETKVLTVGGIEFTIKPTGWKDANGVWGYLRMPGVGTVQTARLGAREQAQKGDGSTTSSSPAPAH